MSDRDFRFPGKVIWITLGYPWPGDEVQGSFHRTAVRALASLGIRIRVISPVPASPWPLPFLKRRWERYAATPSSYRDADIQVDRPRFLALPSLPKWSRPEAAMASAVGRALRQSEQVALVHSHFAFPVAVAGRMVADRLARPHVVTVHGGDINDWPATHRSQLPGVVDALRSADALIAVSNALAERTEALCGRRPEVIPIGIDIRGFTADLPDRLRARKMLGIETQRFVALFVGHLSREKGAVRLVDGVLLADDVITCIMVGDGPGLGYRTDDAGGRVRYLGVRRSSEVALLMRAADVVVLPSDSEGLPTVLVEAGAVGTFVIASRVGGIPELIGNGRGLLLDDLSPASLAFALESTAADPGGTAACVAALRAHVGEHYDAHKNAAHQADLYERVLSRGPST
jgi:teichuronic acid biosynthesis glycosyltransferase TuaC